MDGWMLGKCCLFGVSDLFLTFPGVFFNFKKISTGSQTRNNFREKAEAIKPTSFLFLKRGHVRNEFAKRRAPGRTRISTAFGNQHFANTPYVDLICMFVGGSDCCEFIQQEIINHKVSDTRLLHVGG